MIFSCTWSCLTTLLVATSVICQDSLNCKTVELQEGSEGKIFCLPRNGDPGQSVRWSRGGVPIVDDGTFKIEKDGLVILKVDRKHAGDNYRVYWTDPDDGTKSDKAAVVVVLVPPKFTNLQLTFSSEIGSNATLDLTVDSLPKAATCRWYDKLGQAVVESDRMLLSGCSLHILNVQGSDAGMYTCIATSKVGVASTSATLTVPGDTREATPPHPVMSMERSSTSSTSFTISLHGPNQGVPVSSVHCIYSLLHDRKLPNEQSVVWPIGAGRNDFTVSGLRPGYMYRVHCASVGIDLLRSQWSENLDVKLEPPVPFFWLEHLNKDSLRLKWDLPIDLMINNPNNIIEYQLSYKTGSQTRGQWSDDTFSCPVVITLSTCGGGRMWDIFNPSNKFYSAKVRVRNDAGWSQWTTEITVGGASFA